MTGDDKGPSTLLVEAYNKGLSRSGSDFGWIVRLVALAVPY